MSDCQKISPQLVAKHFRKAAQNYDHHAILQKEIGHRLLSKLALLKEPPSRIIDIGAGTGQHTQSIQQAFPHATLIGLDIALNMMQKAKNTVCSLHDSPSWICANTFALPFPTHTFDLIFSNATLQWCLPLHLALAEWQRILRPKCPIFFSTFGPQTLKELQSSWQAVSKKAHTNIFLSLQEVSEALHKAGFQDIVLEREEITITYANVKGLLQDLKGVGSHNNHPYKSQGLITPNAWQGMLQAYQTLALPDGQIPATYEILYGHAWTKPKKIPLSRDLIEK
ncbi:MAG TPA: malonyl-ACP O-methyltransferase BioC [Gammaproteobacteria bacterium]|nr:malonyl-ACP O-methyltransferase BioC [Gammaproteobacteria bacterium]